MHLMMFAVMLNGDIMNACYWEQLTKSTHNIEGGIPLVKDW